MSKMKHLLRKLHTGSLSNTSPSQNPSPFSSPSISSTMGRIGTFELPFAYPTASDTGTDFNWSEEEFQVQWALANSASDPRASEEVESVQIDAAKRMSLGCRSASVTEADALVEYVSLRYWACTKYQKRILAVVFVLFEGISIILDVFGASTWAFCLASFLLSAFGVVMTLYTTFFMEKGNWKPLTSIEIGFSFTQLIVTYIDLVLKILRVKNIDYNYKASAFPLVFSIFVLVSAFKTHNQNPRSDGFDGGSIDNLDNNSGESTQHRRLWVEDQNKYWWEERNRPDFPEDQFRPDFRMSKGTFSMICEELETEVMNKNTMLHDAIPIRQRVAVCIWKLATGEPLWVVSERFGLGISTCQELFLEVCSAITTVLMPKFLQWPDEQKLKQIKDEFEFVSGIPNVVGSMYTTHVPIIALTISDNHYFNKRHTERNKKTSSSITVQGVVDPRGIFSDVCIGWPGSIPDDQVLEKSALYQRANTGQLKDVWIVGTSGHPLMDWVLVPYTRKSLKWSQHAFNETIGEVQRVAKEAFTRLKRRWSCLQKRTEVKLQDLPAVVAACCVLHNICEMRNEEMDPKFQFELFDDEMIPENSLRSATSAQARDHIAHNLLFESKRNKPSRQARIWRNKPIFHQICLQINKDRVDKQA